MEKQFYSKLCIAESIKFVTDEANRNGTGQQMIERFSCNLATILARDKEVVAVMLTTSINSCTVYISKRDWFKKDDEYIRKIERHLRSISKDAPITLVNALKRDDVRALFKDVMAYCSVKFESRFEKLKKDITRNQDEPYIKSFRSFMGDASIDVDNIKDVERHVISRVCCKYYKKVKTSPAISERFLRHLKKVGSYIGSLINITRCVCNEFHRDQISNLELRKLHPDTTFQTISSWNSIIQKYFDNPKEFKDFRNACLNDTDTKKKLIEIYGEPLATQLDSEIRLGVCLHAEMNILADIINRKDKRRAFIATSKNCCYLCELYIKFARDRRYNIVVSGSHKKIYHAWKLPDIKDYNFWKDSLSYLLSNLNQIIGNEVKKRNILLSDDSFDLGDQEIKEGIDAIFV
ncbi:hypothetical protein C1645_838899 [Glomus cerebriforme]|uniref:Uncharacterized protein n=1 Tax=Glomus cerebriforme TaxID=658196 RepID=A0A397S6J5_9GLOM|nr:hypothetical protein C1645_838899 [Glomus cerebriforme]